MVFTKEWFHAAGIRALKTVAQTAIATIGSAVVISFCGLEDGGFCVHSGGDPVHADKRGRTAGGAGLRAGRSGV